MSKNILFIVEGKTERKIVKNLLENFLNLSEQKFFIGVFETCIYELYKEIVNEKEIDLFSLLIEKKIIDDKSLSNSEIHLVFDLEPHYHDYSDDVIKEMVCFFDNETENGKLHINYPTIEALFHLSDFSKCHNEFLKVNLDGFTGKKYKKEVKEVSCFKSDSNIRFDLKIKDFQKKALILNYFRYCYVTQKEDYISYLSDLKVYLLNHIEVLEKQLLNKNKNNKIYALSMTALILIDFDPNLFVDIILEYTNDLKINKN